MVARFMEAVGFVWSVCSVQYQISDNWTVTGHRIIVLLGHLVNPISLTWLFLHLDVRKPLVGRTENQFVRTDKQERPLWTYFTTNQYKHKHLVHPGDVIYVGNSWIPVITNPEDTKIMMVLIDEMCRWCSLCVLIIIRTNTNSNPKDWPQ